LFFVLWFVLKIIGVCKTTTGGSAEVKTTRPPQDRELMTSSSSAAVNVGLVVGLTVGAAVAAGAAAVAVGFGLSSSAASASAPLTQSLMSSANVSPLYTADVSAGTNALF
jgi:hypothetical protein